MTGSNLIARRTRDALLDCDCVDQGSLREASRSKTSLSRMIRSAAFGLLALAGLAALGLATAAPAQAACIDHIFEAERDAGIPSGLLLAVALVESGQSITSDSYAINVGGNVHFASSPSAAAKYLRDPKGNLRTNVTAGCMQLSLEDHKAAFKPVEKIVDPKENVHYAARMLSQLRRMTGSWAAAVAKYNGGFGKTAQAYACKVRNNLVSLHSMNAALIDSDGCKAEPTPAVTPRTRRAYEAASDAAAPAG